MYFIFISARALETLPKALGLVIKWRIVRPTDRLVMKQQTMRFTLDVGKLRLKLRSCVVLAFKDGPRRLSAVSYPEEEEKKKMRSQTEEKRVFTSLM